MKVKNYFYRLVAPVVYGVMLSTLPSCNFATMGALGMKDQTNPNNRDAYEAEARRQSYEKNPMGDPDLIDKARRGSVSSSEWVKILFSPQKDLDRISDYPADIKPLQNAWCPKDQPTNFNSGMALTLESPDQVRLQSLKTEFSIAAYSNISTVSTGRYKLQKSFLDKTYYLILDDNSSSGNIKIEIQLVDDNNLVIQDLKYCQCGF